MKNILSKISVIGLAGLLSLSANSADGDEYIGLGLGYGSVTSEGGGGFVTYSGRAGKALYTGANQVFSLGVHYGTLSSKDTVAGIEVSERIHAFMGEALSSKLWGTRFYAGARFGLASVKVKLTGAGTSVKGSDTGTIFGPVVGYEFPIAEKFGLGVDLSWLRASGGTLSFPATGSQVEYDPTHAVLMQAIINYRW